MILIFNGPPGSGKDDACEYLETKGWVHMRIKDQLFEDTFKYFNVHKEWFMNGYTRDLKDRKQRLLGNKSRREALIFVSEEIMKPKYGKSYYGMISSKQLNDERDYCFSDGGFIDEIEPIINKGIKTIVINLYRKGCDFSNDSRNYIHCNVKKEYVLGETSEIDFDFKTLHFQIPSYRIFNNSSIEDFYRSIDDIISEESHEGKPIRY